MGVPSARYAITDPDNFPAIWWGLLLNSPFPLSCILSRAVVIVEISMSGLDGDVGELDVSVDDVTWD